MAKIVLFFAHANPFLQVRTSAKGIVHLAGKNQRPRRSLAAFSVQSLDHIAQLAEKLLREGIPSSRTVERYDSDTAGMWGWDARDLDRRREGAIARIASPQPLSSEAMAAGVPQSCA